MAIYHRTKLKEIPKSCDECTILGYGCYLPEEVYKIDKDFSTTRIKETYKTKRHPQCSSFIKVSEPEK